MQRAILLALLGLSYTQAATVFDLDKTDSIVCSDSLSNVCTAPTDCNKNGKVDFDAGENFNVGSTTQQNGMWTIVGGYTISFPSQCEVTCQGDCTCSFCATRQVGDFQNDAAKPDSSADGPLKMVASIVLGLGAWMLL